MFFQLFPFGIHYSCSHSRLKMMALSQCIFSLANTWHWENWLEKLSQIGELVCSCFAFFFFLIFQKHLTVGWESLWAIKTDSQEMCWAFTKHCVPKWIFWKVILKRLMWGNGICSWGADPVAIVPELNFLSVYEIPVMFLICTAF